MPVILHAACFDKALYPYLEECAEWNVKQAVPEAHHVFAAWPTEVYVIPFETGYDILTAVPCWNRRKVIRSASLMNSLERSCGAAGTLVPFILL